MMRGTVIGVLSAGCVLALGPASYSQQQPPEANSTAVEAQVKALNDKARREYGTRSADYYRELARKLPDIVGPPPSPPAPRDVAVAPAPRVAPEPKGGPAPASSQLPAKSAQQKVPAAAAEKILQSRNFKGLFDAAVAEAAAGQISARSMKVFESLSSVSKLPAAPPAPDGPSKEMDDIVAAITRTVGRGTPGALRLQALRPGLKDRVIGLSAIPTVQGESSISADPIDPYPETAALGTGAPRSDPSRSLCSGVLISRSKDLQSGAVLTAAHCACDSRLTHVYFGHNLFRTPLCSGDPDHDAGMPIFDSQFLAANACSSNRAGADVAIVFFKKAAPPGYKNYFLDRIVQDTTASIPDPALMKVLTDGLIDNEEMTKSAYANAGKLADLLKLNLENYFTDVVVRAEFGALVDSLTPKRLPVGVTVVGFGATATTGDVSSVGCKGWAHFTRRGFRKCVGEGPVVGNCVAGKEIVLDEPDDDGNDTCPGDSGGPVFMETRDVNGNYVRYLIGLTSRAARPDPDTQCGAKRGGIYSLVARDEVLQFVSRALALHGMQPNIARIDPPKQN